MLTKYVMTGDRIELESASVSRSGEGKKKKYYSQVTDILSEDKIEIAMPMEKSKLLLIPLDMEVFIYFFTKNGLYQCKAKVRERYKKSNIFLLKMEITSQLNKYQRREYYRCACAIDIYTRTISKEEIKEEDSKVIYQLDPNKKMEKAIMVDISGGGIRMVTESVFEKGARMLGKFTLSSKEGIKEYSTISEILYVTPLENKKGYFEYRMQFVHIGSKDREAIIKFIFEEERKYRKREKG